MESWDLEGITLEYDEDTHTYIADGIIVPSVTQIIKDKLGNKYSTVAPEVLKRASIRGTAIHKSIEDYCTQGIEDTSPELKDFKFLQRYYKFKPIKNEIPVVIVKDGIPVTAGRMDLVIEIDNSIAIADIKTTATLDKEYLAYQLNLYRIGLKQSYGIEATKLYGIHLKDGKRKLVDIPVNEALAWLLLERS